MTDAVIHDSAFPDSEDMLLLDRQVCFPLYAASNLLNRLYRPVLAQFNLTYPQYLVMLVLWEQSPVSVGDLGGKLFLDSGTLTPLLKRLEVNGMVNRQRDPADERRVLIYLTEQGQQLKQRAAVIPQTLGNSLNLSVEQIEQLRTQVQQIVGIMAQALQQGKD
jgi:DNA-binding MarR family transcriptional regulator